MDSALRFGSLTIRPPLLLAPMAGLTHSALRTTILLFGGVGLLSTEMLSAARLPAENPHLSPFLIRTPAEQPLSHQLLVSTEQHLPKAIERLHAIGADAVDLNLGCPAPQVRKFGGGALLMEEPDLVRRIVAQARQHTSLPLSAKIRLGESFNEDKLCSFCRMLEGEGIDLLTVHARLRAEPFARKPHWHWIAKVKQWLRIPVVANGSIDTVAGARACLEVTGADGLMIGRRAAGAPWIFAEIARAVYHVSLPEPALSRPATYQHFSRALASRFPPERRLGRLKEFTHYFAKNYAFGHHLASSVQASASFQEACERAGAFFQQHDPTSVEKVQVL
ncbi:MAG: tRNA-dihydrouridine synthase family protein [bacterium]|nr:tRNA-dihydrouridine synthase family protein [bacterium]